MTSERSRGWRSPLSVRRLLADPFLLFAAAAVGLVLLVFPGFGPHRTAPTSAALAAVPLTDDDGDGALFTEPALRPGHPVQACLKVSADPASTGRVHLEAQITEATLAPYLQVVLESGTGGGYGNCGGFVPETTPFSGTLEQLGVPGGVDTGWQLGAATTRTFRVTATVADTAPQATSARAMLVWGLEPAGSATPSPSPAPSLSAVPSPAVAPTTPAPSGARTIPPAPTAGPRSPTGDPLPAPAEPSATPTPEPSATPPASATDGPGGGGRDGDGTGELAGRALPTTVAEQVLMTAAGVAEHSGFPALLLVGVLLFMGLQNRLDGRDPKLALAPIHQQPTLPFDPPPHPSPGERP